MVFELSTFGATLLDFLGLTPDGAFQAVASLIGAGIGAGAVAWVFHADLDGLREERWRAKADLEDGVFRLADFAAHATQELHRELDSNKRAKCVDVYRRRRWTATINALEQVEIYKLPRGAPQSFLGIISELRRVDDAAAAGTLTRSLVAKSNDRVWVCLEALRTKLVTITPMRIRKN